MNNIPEIGDTINVVLYVGSNRVEAVAVYEFILGKIQQDGHYLVNAKDPESGLCVRIDTVELCTREDTETGEPVQLVHARGVLI